MNTDIHVLPVVEAIRDRLVGDLAPEQLMLFGSYAKGTSTVHSDIDILVVTNARVPEHRQAAARAQFHGFPVNVDLVFYTRGALEREAARPYTFAYTVLLHAKAIYGDCRKETARVDTSRDGDPGILRVSEE